MSNHFRGIVSNNHFFIEKETMNIVPQVEIIIHYSFPVYEEITDTKVRKLQKISDFRMTTNKDGIELLISSLQTIKQNMEVMENMGEAMNRLVADVRADQAAKEPIADPKDMKPTNESPAST